MPETDLRLPDVASPRHVFSIRVYYEDTDAAGIVYYANYLRFAERARTEMLRDFGFDHVTMRDEEDLMFAVRHCEADYVRPARLDDLIEVETASLGATGASLWLRQTVRRAGRPEMLVDMKVRLVCIRRDGRPARLPATIRTAFSAQTH